MEHFNGNQPTADELIRYFNGLELKLSYKTQILKTYARMYPMSPIPVKLGATKVPGVVTKNVNREAHMNGIRNLIVYSVEFLVALKMKQTNSAKTISRGRIETIVAIVIVYFTNLRSGEIRNLTVRDLGKILRGDTVSVRIKARNVLLPIARPPIFEKAYPYLIYALAEAYDMILPNSENPPPRFANQHEFDVFLTSPDTSKISGKQLISCSFTTINKELKEFFTKINHIEPYETLGLKTIRQHNTQKLADLGDPEVSAVFNRHASSTTTDAFYNIPDPTLTFNAMSVKVETQKLIDRSEIL
jgi:hypothetical protein